MTTAVPAAPKDFFYQRERGTPRAAGSDQQVRVFLRFAGRLDLKLLERAVGALVDEDPILRARFVEARVLDARWELHPGFPAPACVLVETDHPDAAIAAFLSGLEVENDGPYVRLQVARNRGEDSLCLRVDHRLADGGGTKLLVHRLVDRYRRLAAGLPLPPPLSHFTPRTIAGLVGRPLPSAPSPAPLPPKPRPRGPTYAIPRIGQTNERPMHARRVLAPGPVEALRKRARDLGATLNDVLLAAQVRALQPFALVPAGDPVVVQVSADARSRLPQSAPESICNLFVPTYPELRCEPAQPFTEAVAATARATAQVRATLTLDELLQGEVAFEEMLRRWIDEFAWPSPAPGIGTHVILSNLGVLDERPLDPGMPALVHAEMLGTIALGRQILIAASRFRGALTLSSGFCASDVEPAIIESLLDGIAAQMAAFAAGAQ